MGLTEYWEWLLIYIADKWLKFRLSKNGSKRITNSRHFTKKLKFLLKCICLDLIYVVLR